MHTREHADAARSESGGAGPAVRGPGLDDRRHIDGGGPIVARPPLTERCDRAEPSVLHAALGVAELAGARECSSRGGRIAGETQPGRTAAELVISVLVHGLARRFARRIDLACEHSAAQDTGRRVAELAGPARRRGPQRPRLRGDPRGPAAIRGRGRSSLRLRGRPRRTAPAPRSLRTWGTRTGPWTRRRRDDRAYSPRPSMQTRSRPGLGERT